MSANDIALIIVKMEVVNVGFHIVASQCNIIYQMFPLFYESVVHALIVRINFTNVFTYLHARFQHMLKFKHLSVTRGELVNTMVFGPGVNYG